MCTVQSIKDAIRENCQSQHDMECRLNAEFPDGKVDMKKLSEEYSTLEQTHSETYAQFKTIREDLQRLWSVKSKIDTARSFHERTEEQTLQNRPQTRHKKEDIDR